MVSLEHEPFEDPRHIATWASRRGALLRSVKLYAGQTLASPDGVDLLVVMGGTMSVNDRLSHPWLSAELALIAEATHRGIPILGVCLGAQIVASALGARVYPARCREVGWHTVRRASGVGGAPNTSGLFVFPDAIPLFHWHGETFDLPHGAVLLASSDACANQVFAMGRRILGVQCHPEMTPEGALALVRACPGDLQPGPWVQTAQAILDAPAAWYTEANRLTESLLDHLTGP